MRVFSLVVVGGLTWACAGTLIAQDYPHAFPRAGTTKLLENERVIVWDATWPDGVPQPYHRHRYDMTGVFFRWGPLRVTRLDGTFTANPEPFEVPWVFFQGKGVTHKEEGIGTPERHSLMVDIKEYSGQPREVPGDLRTAFPRPEAEIELDNPRVTVWDTRWPEAEDTFHVHARDTVVIFIEGGKLRTRDPDGFEQLTRYFPEDLLFFPAGTAHASTTVGMSPRAMFYVLKD